jgi:hypothetical protein
VNATVLRLVWRVRPPQDPHTHMTLMKRAFKLGRGLSVARQHAECLTPQLLQKLARALDLAPAVDLRGCTVRPGGGGGGGGGGGISAEGHVLLDARATAAVWARQLAGVRATQRCNKLRIVTVGISGGRSLTGPLRDGRRFPSTRGYPVPKLHVRRRGLGFVHRSRVPFSVAPCQTRSVTIRNFCIAVCDAPSSLPSSAGRKSPDAPPGG